MTVSLAKPPATWFNRPEQIPTDRRLTVTDDGRIYGYVSLWGTCHTGLPNCVTPPRNPDMSLAHTGIVVADDGSEIPVGTIAAGIGHARPNGQVMAAAEHYDNSDRAVARVHYGTDDHGIWFSGAIRPGLSDSEIADVRASATSGDWRFLNQWRKSQGHDAMQLIGSVLVNIPGYPLGNVQSGTPTQIAASAQSIDFVLEDEIMTQCACETTNEAPVTAPEGQLTAESIAAAVADGVRAAMAEAPAAEAPSTESEASPEDSSEDASESTDWQDAVGSLDQRLAKIEAYLLATEFD